jgi:hypothetical protein
LGRRSAIRAIASTLKLDVRLENFQIFQVGAKTKKVVPDQLAHSRNTKVGFPISTDKSYMKLENADAIA